MEVQLTEGVRVRVRHFARVRKDYGAYRVILSFMSDFPHKNKVLKDYYVWLTDIFTDDYLGISRKTTEMDFKTVALALARKRFDECDKVPPEEGLDASNERGIIMIKDAKNYIHPVEISNDKPAETN